MAYLAYWIGFGFIVLDVVVDDSSTLIVVVVVVVVVKLGEGYSALVACAPHSRMAWYRVPGRSAITTRVVCRLL